MEILLIHQAFTALDEPGGTRHHELARHLQNLGHQLTIITGQGSYLTGERTTAGSGVVRQVDDVGVIILRIPGYLAWHRSFFHRVLSFLSFMVRAFLEGLRAGEVELVWGTSPPIFQAVSAALLAKWRQVPFVLEVRDLWPYFAIASGVLRSKLLIGMSNWLERRLYQAADVVVVNSPGFSEYVSQRGAKRVEVIPNGVDCNTDLAVEVKEDLREQLGIQESFIVVYAGAHGLSNDLVTVLKAGALLKAREDIQLVLIGAGKEKANLVARTQAEKLTNVHFVDPVPKMHMPAILAQANAGLAILMAIDAYKTTFPNKVFDYMAAGLPVLCAIDGVIREVVEQGAAGVFVEPGNPEALAQSIRMLAEDRERATKMGANGRRWVCDHYDRSALANDLATIMQGLLT